MSALPHGCKEPAEKKHLILLNSISLFHYIIVLTHVIFLFVIVKNNTDEQRLEILLLSSPLKPVAAKRPIFIHHQDIIGHVIVISPLNKQWNLLFSPHPFGHR